MNIGTHQYPQLQPLLFHLPDGAGRAQAVLKPRGEGGEVSEDKYAKEELSLPFRCLGVELGNASSLESHSAPCFGTGGPVYHSSNTDAHGLGEGGEAVRHQKRLQGLQSSSTAMATQPWLGC